MAAALHFLCSIFRNRLRNLIKSSNYLPIFTSHEKACLIPPAGGLEGLFGAVLHIVSCEAPIDTIMIESSSPRQRLFLIIALRDPFGGGIRAGSLHMQWVTMMLIYHYRYFKIIPFLTSHKWGFKRSALSLARPKFPI